MIFGFFKKLIKYYIDKLVHWLRMQKFNLELDNESPPSLGIYIGWKIIRSYLDNNNISLINMLQADSQSIFKNAKFKPRK